MIEDRNQESNKQQAIAGAFVETAFTNNQVELAIAEEEWLEIRDADCSFLQDEEFARHHERASSTGITKKRS